MISHAVESHKNSWIEGFCAAFPIILGYIPIGVAYGVLAKEAGLSSVNAILMSVMVYAGSGQLIAVGLFGGGVSAVSIIITTFIVNFRHFLMAASVTTFLKNWRNRDLISFSFQLTDETFALHTTRFSKNKVDKKTTFRINILCHGGWVGGSIIGVLATELLQDTQPWALDFALPAMFIALLALQITRPVQLMVGILAGGLSVILFLIGLEQWNVILATIMAATFGVGVNKWIRI